MGRKSTIEICRVCGKQAKKINYFSRAKNKTYYYYKYVHNDGTVHYYKRDDSQNRATGASSEKKDSLLNLLEEIINVRTQDKKLNFSDIKSLLREIYNVSYSSSTIYRNIERLIKLNLIEKEIEHGRVFYKKKSTEAQTGNVIATTMSIGLVLADDDVLTTIFIQIQNGGLGTIPRFSISLPAVGLGSGGSPHISIYDETGPISLKDDNILVSAPDQIVIGVPFNQALRQFGSRLVFLAFVSRFTGVPFKMVATFQIKNLKVSCKVRKGRQVKIDRLLLDGLKRIEPQISRKTAMDSDFSILEAEFEGLSRGDTITISPQ
ncbi:MAG: hypothetical protein QXN66_06475 [Thermoplasmatales archaeon]